MSDQPDMNQQQQQAPVKRSFGTADRSKRRIKVLLLGKPKTGKTRAALSFPRPALIDSEGGWEYIDEYTPAGISQTKDLDECIALIGMLRADNGATYDSMLIDSITVFFAVDTYRLRREKGAKFGYSERALVNDRMGALYNSLTQMPIHVCVLAREDDVYITENGTLKKTGRGADADKAIYYPFDFVIQMNTDYSGTVLYSRGNALPQGHILKTVSFDTLESALKTDSLTNVNGARAFVMFWRGEGMSDPDILAALGVEKVSLWAGSRADADAAVKRFREHGTPPPEVHADENVEPVVVEDETQPAEPPPNQYRVTSIKAMPINGTFTYLLKAGKTQISMVGDVLIRAMKVSPRHWNENANKWHALKPEWNVSADYDADAKVWTVHEIVEVNDDASV